MTFTTPTRDMNSAYLETLGLMPYLLSSFTIIPWS
jgi:hypothetical protein